MSHPVSEPAAPADGQQQTGQAAPAPPPAVPAQPPAGYIATVGPGGAVPQFVAPVPSATTTGGAPATVTFAAGTTQGAPAPAAAEGPDGYPANTPIAQMTPDQQVAYWRTQARKHEDRVKAMGDYDQLKSGWDEYQRLLTASQTEQEKAVAEARRQGHAEALSAAGGQLVEQWVRAAAAGRLGEESVNALLAGLDRSRFLAQNGGVDTDRVYAFVNSIAPAAAQPASAPVAGGSPVQQSAPVQAPTVTPAGGPDFGQGHPSTSRPSGIEAGREIARKRFTAAQSTSAPARP